MLQLNKMYSLSALAAELGESRPKSPAATAKLLNHIASFVEYHTEQKRVGGRDYYVIDKVIAPYIKQSEFNHKVISDFVSEMIDAEPYHTPSSLGRRATHDEEVKKTKYAQSTIKEYVKIDLRTKYYIKEKLWGKVLDIDTPEEVVSPLEDNELQTLKELFKKYGSEKMEKDGALLEEYNEGMITREEYLESLGDANAAFFNNAKTEFSKIYGFRPIRIGVYDRTAY